MSQKTAFAVFEKAETFYLDNGMQVVVVPNHKAPIVYHAVLYKVGSIDEATGKGGLAHLTEHLMFRGTHHFPDGKFNKLIENNGGRSNAGTSHDYTYYHQFLNIKSLELAMYLEADRMKGLALSDEVFSQERKIVYQERQQRLNASVDSDFWEKFNKFYYGDNPYGNPISGTENEINSLSISDVNNFYDKFYAPNNAILILSGDIDVNTAKNLAQKYYGSIKPSKISNKEFLALLNLDKLQKQDTVISTKQEDVSVNRAIARYAFPRFSGDDKKLYSLILYSQWLGDGVNSLLYKELVEKQKISVSTNVDFSFLSRGNPLLTFSTYLKKESDFSKLQKSFYSVLKSSQKQLNAKIVSEMKEKILSGLIYQNDNPAHAANIIIEWLSAGYTLDDIKNFEKNINDVTTKDIQDVINDITKIYPVWGVVSPLGGNNEK